MCLPDLHASAVFIIGNRTLRLLTLSFFINMLILIIIIILNNLFPWKNIYLCFVFHLKLEDEGTKERMVRYRKQRKPWRAGKTMWSPNFPCTCLLKAFLYQPHISFTSFSLFLPKFPQPLPLTLALHFSCQTWYPIFLFGQVN